MVPEAADPGSGQPLAGIIEWYHTGYMLTLERRKPAFKMFVVTSAGRIERWTCRPEPVNSRMWRRRWRRPPTSPEIMRLLAGYRDGDRRSGSCADTAPVRPAIDRLGRCASSLTNRTRISCAAARPGRKRHEQPTAPCRQDRNSGPVESGMRDMAGNRFNRTGSRARPPAHPVRRPEASAVRSWLLAQPRFPAQTRATSRPGAQTMPGRPAC